MGPAPKPAHQRRRRNRDLSTTATRLPASGRPGPPPSWPLTNAAPREAQTWAELWRLPQAVAWEALALERPVARYVRALVASEDRGAATPLLAEVRQLEDRLGLNPMALLRLRWQVVDDEVADVVFGPPDGSSPADPNGRRLRVVDPKLVGGTGSS